MAGTVMRVARIDSGKDNGKVAGMAGMVMSRVAVISSGKDNGKAAEMEDSLEDTSHCISSVDAEDLQDLWF